MAITHDDLRIASTDGYGTGRNDRLTVRALPDLSPGLDSPYRSGANALLRTFLAIQGDGTLLDRLERLVNAAVDLLQRADVAVAVLDEPGATLEVAAAAGRLLEARGRRVTVLDSLLGAVVRCGQSRLLGDVRLDPRVESDTFSTTEGTRSWLGVPLVGPDGAFGALVVVDAAPHVFCQDDEQALNALACLTSAALADTRSRELAQRRRDRDEQEQCPQDFAETAADVGCEQDEYRQPTFAVADSQPLAEPWPRGARIPTWDEIASRDIMAEQASPGDLDLDTGRPLHDVEFRRRSEDADLWMSSVNRTPVFDARGVSRDSRGDGITDVAMTQETAVVSAGTSAALDARSRQVTAVADLGQFALATDALQDVLNAAAMVVAGVFDADCSQVLRVLPDGSALLIEAGLALPDGLAVRHVPEWDAQSQCGYALAVGEPVIVADLSREDRFRPMPTLLERGMVSGVLVPIVHPGRPYGLLGLYARREIRFADEDVQFLRSIANILATAIDASRSRHLTEALIEQAPDPIARYDAQLRIVTANLALGLTIGRPVTELLGQTIRSLSCAPSPQVINWETVAQSVLRSGREREAELSLSTPLGDRDYQMRFVPELGANGQVESLLVVARDISDRHRVHAERAALYEELLERDLRLRDLIGDLHVEHREERAQDRRLADATFIESQMTAREVEILGMVVAGLTNQQIAVRLHLSAGTVRNRLGHLFPKLDVVNRAQAAARAVELGLVTPSGA